MSLRPAGLAIWEKGPRVIGLRSLSNTLLSFVYPECCQVCSEAPAVPEEGYLCAGCAAGLRRIERPFCERCGLPVEGEVTEAFQCPNCHERTLHFSSARSVFAARGVGRELVHRYKYHRALWFEPLFESLFRSVATQELRAGRWDVILPVPLHSLKRREREFNQAERLARLLGRSTGIPVHTGTLVRISHTETQTHLSRAARNANVKSAFELQGEWPEGWRRVVLVDDVLTTGATTNACARVLRNAGAEEVVVWTLARGI